ncbi:hypothetical protein IAU60_006698 [Kwoniella sp. DSM 27419]
MLISPARVHSTLTSILGPKPSSGPHTALLITPQGQLVSAAHIPLDVDEEDESDRGVEGAVGMDGQAEAEQSEGLGEGEDDEPYLETQERKRLLLGLASQWNDSEGQKMECELGRLYFTYIPIPVSPQPTVSGRDHLPGVRPPPVDGFVLVLNGAKAVPWSAFTSKSAEFQQKWRA